MLPQATRVRVLIVNYRSAQLVRDRLSSPALRDSDVIVVDNASEPDEVAALCSELGATPLLLDRNTGFAGGVNAAWRLAQRRDPLPLLLLNPDAELDESTLRLLLDRLEATGATGVGPVLVEPTGRLQVGAAGGPLSLASVAAYFLCLSHVFTRWRGIFLTRRQSLEGGPVAWLCMASLLLRPDALQQYGELPEDELVYAEDVAWGTKASLQGARFVLVPEARVLHAHGSSGGSQRWTGALERLIRRRLTPDAGRLAVLSMRLGLAARVLLRRVVRS